MSTCEGTEPGHAAGRRHYGLRRRQHNICGPPHRIRRQGGSTVLIAPADVVDGPASMKTGTQPTSRTPSPSWHGRVEAVHELGDELQCVQAQRRAGTGPVAGPKWQELEAALEFMPPPPPPPDPGIFNFLPL